ncbi:PrgH/EprH family type III secretion apparatus protein [Erwinia tasmaniensis]|uniref:Type III secretion system protein n=1 Tax=Erwinia tasmaniensis (strain DSM 17950 / CFBP 7177 / CIP 109463 / NCPPB 4357 / Et1/99) TaxID=465817 RepID=B2VEF8_ERWT9|nr:PrgH/EprH family type III secretion apparatus protein [Erwinia tasmaniensis]CAO96956.1 Type III secretion system protein [Erwinia tasmaniensis Et1/99]
MTNNIEKPITTEHLNDHKSNFTLKVLFGPMFGCELHLTDEDYFFIISSKNSLLPVKPDSPLEHAHSTHYTHNTLYIPCDYPAPNILLRLSSLFHNERGSVVGIEIYDSSEISITEIYENEVFVHGNILFAFKHSQEKWSEEIIGFKSQNTAINKNSLNCYTGASRKNFRSITFSLPIIMITLLVLVLIYLYNHFNNNQNQKEILNQIVSSTLTPIAIVRSRDEQTIFVLVSQKHEMEWLKKKILIQVEKSRIIPLWIAQQKKTIVSQLIQLGYPVLQLDYSLPLHPVITVHEKLNKNKEDSLKSVVLEKIPYAIDTEVLFKSKEMLLAEARKGLVNLNIQFRQIEAGAGYSLIIRDAPSDLILHRLGEFIDSFQHKWGTEIINFSINQEEDWLFNKSYIDSKDGYLFLTPRHWYLPLHLGEMSREQYKQK